MCMCLCLCLVPGTHPAHMVIPGRAWGKDGVWGRKGKTSSLYSMRVFATERCGRGRGDGIIARGTCS